MVIGRPRKGVPRIRTPLQIVIHILESDYNILIMSRQYPRETIYDILHRKLDRLEHLEQKIRDIQAELDGYKEFIISKGLEEELNDFLYKLEEAPTEHGQKVQENAWNVPNKYPNWDI
jgi:hypothetical protein